MSKIIDLIAKYCPNGVEYKSLGEICDILDSRRKPITKSKRTAGEFPYYGANGIQDRVSGYLFDGTFLLVGEDGSVINPNKSPVLNWATGKIWVNNHAHVLSERQDVANLRYVYFALSATDVSDIVRGTPPKLNQQNLRNIQIPVPPLPVQQEIVRILDSFTELEAELEARKKQYEHYRDKLLNFADISQGGVRTMALSEICNFRRGSFPQPYGEEKWYGGDGAMPFVQVVDVGNDLRLVNNTKNKISVLAQPMSVFVPNDTVIVSIQGSIGRVALTQYDSYVDRTLAIFSDYKIDISKKYFAYQLQRVFGIEKEFARGGIIKTITKEEFAKFQIPIPPLAEQERIVAILDKFDALVNDISDGLPAEINARRQQYEYYRDKLLSFPMAA